ncbi:uncharacterized protein LOC125502748 isoform X2 [Dendroctonus ponderosae]|uniref:uncharacterized protein LOC125502748 isoform X2 n=1 Tax=Dendroctonus ponderosae TaxID=77166 RepID=UPI0020363788|nr:uncharacterized protein LOC125502748 isoform X2 [Dendroctonus ponderosae]
MHQPFLILSLFACAKCIWPPDYEVKLKYEEEFVISDPLDPSDIQDIYDEEELISQEARLHANAPDKYFRLHSLARVENAQQKPLEVRRTQQIYPESNPELEEAKPWIAGFVDSNNNIVPNEDTVYFDEDAKSNSVEKREASNASDYNYAELRAQYEEAEKKANNSLKYSEVKEEESAAEAVKSLVDLTPRNCTSEDTSGLAIEDVRCFWIEARSKHLNNQTKFSLLKKVALIATVWLCAYCLIAVPLWCQYGWCCCCCTCKFCHPRQEIDLVKEFCAKNPPGVLYDKEGNLKHYKPTTYEKYAQKNLEKAIAQL